MRVGVSPFASTRSGVLALAARAVEGGIGMLWLGDGLLVNPDFPLWSGGLEPFTELAWLAGRFEGVTVGRHARVRRAIIDKGVQIPEGVEVGYDLDADRRRGFTVTDSGIVVLGKLDGFTD